MLVMESSTSIWTLMSQNESGNMSSDQFLIIPSSSVMTCRPVSDIPGRRPNPQCFDPEGTVSPTAVLRKYHKLVHTFIFFYIFFFIIVIACKTNGLLLHTGKNWGKKNKKQTYHRVQVEP